MQATTTLVETSTETHTSPWAVPRFGIMSTVDGFGEIGENGGVVRAIGCLRQSKRDVSDAESKFVDSGHFAIATHATYISERITDFMLRKARP